MLQIKQVSKRFGGIKALNNCSFDVEDGKITALIGPNGSGKTTLFNVINSLLKQNKGKIIFNKQDISNLSTFRVAKAGISRTFQETRLFKNLTIKDHLIMCLDDYDENLFNNVLAPEEFISEKEIKKILDLVELNKPLNTLASELSYGQRKLLDLAMAIAKPHKLILLDEPVAGINPELRKKIKKILLKLKQKGEAILLIEHDMNFVMGLADQIIVLDEGKVIAKGKPKQIQNNKKVLEAYLGE